jgi:peptidoglycan/xylan/chitin deacetylase (PgdA/CDA1 family)
LAGLLTLTFDNGPHAGVTPRVLDCLARHQAPATFFVLGERISTASGAALAREALAAGHRIGSHTWSHARLGSLSAAAAVDEFRRGAEAVAKLGVAEKLFRPVGGGQIGKHLLQPAVIDCLKDGGYTCVLWNSVPGDWRDPHGWLDRALADLDRRPHSLLVLHDTLTGAMDHLDEFLRRAREAGHEFAAEFPPECVPIAAGREVLPLEPLSP